MSHSPIPLQNLTPTNLKTYQSLYPTVLERVYKTSRPKLKQAEILNDDKWRYEELPSLVGPGIALEKEQLLRLVKWKITHGQNRPFLPSMVSKNTPSEITAITLRISDLSTSISQHTSNTTHPNKRAILELIENALTEICTLKGVGPATGSLVLSVYDPRIVPFFGDEVFEWVVGEEEIGKGKGKLKYDWKEYGVFLKRVVDFVLGGGVEGGVEGGVTGSVGADELEKLGYVMGHLDVLEEEEVRGLQSVVGLEEGVTSGLYVVGKEVEVKSGEDDEKSSSVREKVNKKKRSRKQEAVDTVHEAPGTRRSKRIRK